MFPAPCVRTIPHAQMIYDRYRAASKSAVRTPPYAASRVRLRRFRLLDHTRERWLAVPDSLAAQVIL